MTNTTHDYDTHETNVSEGRLAEMLDRFNDQPTWVKNTSYAVAAVAVVAIIMFIMGAFSGNTSSADNATASRFDFSASDPQYTAKDAEFRRLILQKFGEQGSVNSSFQQQLNDVVKIQKVDPKVIDQIQKDIEELKKLSLLKDKVAEIERVNKSLGEKLANLLITSASAQEKPKAPPAAAPVSAPIPQAVAPAPEYEEQAVAEEPQARRQDDASESMSEWRSGKDLFKVAGTPRGFQMTSVNDPQKSAACQPPRHLYRTDVCKKESDGRITCKLGCK